MIPIGYMAKRIPEKPEYLKAPQVLDVYSVAACVNDDVADYGDYWKHNGWWFFDTPEVIQRLSREHSINLQGMRLFYYEAYEFEFDEEGWRPFSPSEDSWKDSLGVVAPSHKTLDGYDVVTIEDSPAPAHSPLSCNSLAEAVRTNHHCLFDTFEEARGAVNSGQFDESEPGALRIFAVYSVDWPS